MLSQNCYLMLNARDESLTAILKHGHFNIENLPSFKLHTPSKCLNGLSLGGLGIKGVPETPDLSSFANFMSFVKDSDNQDFLSNIEAFARDSNAK